MWGWNARKSIHRHLCIDLFGNINLRNFAIYICFHLGTCSQGLIFLRSEHWIRCFSGCTGSASAFIRRQQLGFHLIWLCFWDSQTVSSSFVTAFSSADLGRAEGSFIYKAEPCFYSNAVGAGGQIQLCDRVMWHDRRMDSYPKKPQRPLDRERRHWSVIFS